MLLVFIIALLGALLFNMLSLPIPWLIGPIFSVLIAQFFIKDRLRWPAVLRNTGLIIVGVAIGQQFDLALFTDFKSLLFFMVIVNILLFGFCLGIALAQLSTPPLSSTSIFVLLGILPYSFINAGSGCLSYI